MVLIMSNGLPLKSLAVVVPRFGPNLGGGAEALVASLLTESLLSNICEQPLIEYAEVWTTCALDHRTWKNELEPGDSKENGILVKRFLVSPRNLEPFIAVEHALVEGRLVTLNQQLDWLENSVNSIDLYQHIYEHGKEFDAILFAPYLFATSFWGALVYPERSLLVPCLHDEVYAYLDVFHYLFRKVGGLIFNTEAERDLARRLYKLKNFDSKSAVVGMGFYESGGDVGINKTVELKSSLNLTTPYLLYSGRKETGKNLDFLIKCFVYYKGLHPESSLQLVIIGSGEINFLETLPNGVVDIGFVSEEEKAVLMQEALALCQPSTNESFSIVIMEAWLKKTPVLVHANCAVTTQHVTESNGGLSFKSPEGFSVVVDKLEKEPDLSKNLGANGYQYVRSQYNWQSVLTRFQAALLKLVRR